MSISSINSLAMRVGVPAEPPAPRVSSDDERTLIHAVMAVIASEMLGQENELRFVLEPASRRPLVRIVNKRTGEPVQQIPAEYVLRMAEEMKRG